MPAVNLVLGKDPKKHAQFDREQGEEDGVWIACLFSTLLSLQIYAQVQRILMSKGREGLYGTMDRKGGKGRG